MSLAVRREARRRARAATISELERSVGLPLSEPDAPKLPYITVVRNPTGDWVMWDRWVSEGFGAYNEVSSGTKWGCMRAARKRLRAMVFRDITPPSEVEL